MSFPRCPVCSCEAEYLEVSDNPVETELPDGDIELKFAAANAVAVCEDGHRWNLGGGTAQPPANAGSNDA